jgi:hypothetical protein
MDRKGEADLTDVNDKTDLVYAERSYQWIALKPGCPLCDKIIAYRKDCPDKDIRRRDTHVLVTNKGLQKHGHTGGNDRWKLRP